MIRNIIFLAIGFLLFRIIMNFMFKILPNIKTRAKHFQEETTNDPYEVLGIEKSSTEEEIREAYKTLAAKYHPDKVNHLGKEFQELAHKKFVAIQKAYDSILLKNKK